MLNSSANLVVKFWSVLLIFGCITDLVLLYLFGRQIPGYSQISGTISSLGESASTVSGLVTIWSVILGVIIIVFGFAFKMFFYASGKEIWKASLLIIIYGFGENVASGIFRADHINGTLTTMAIIHNIFGGLGMIAAILLPLVMMKIFSREMYPAFFRLSRIVFAAGLISILLFSLRTLYLQGSFLSTYKGLWQRIFLIDYYIYFITIAFMIIKNNNENSTTN